MNFLTFWKIKLLKQAVFDFIIWLSAQAFVQPICCPFCIQSMVLTNTCMMRLIPRFSLSLCSCALCPKFIVLHLSRKKQKEMQTQLFPDLKKHQNLHSWTETFVAVVVWYPGFILINFFSCSTCIWYQINTKFCSVGQYNQVLLKLFEHLELFVPSWLQ